MGCVRVCAGVRRCARVGVCGCVQVCTSVHRCTRVCVGVHGWVDMGVHGCVCTGAGGCVRVLPGVLWCACVCVCACVWDEFSEFHLENRVPKSADFNTYPIRMFLVKLSPYITSAVITYN